MQILLFVISMLLLLSAITYAKMDSYKSLVLFRKRFEVYSRARHNEFEKNFCSTLYDDIVLTSTGKRENLNHAEGLAYISLFPLFSKEENAESKNFSKKLLKELIPLLYEEEPFYQEIYKKRPSFVNELVEALDMGLKEGKPKKIEEIANIELKDPLLAEAFYKMLKGFSPPQGTNEKKEAGYPSLLCYLTVKGNGKIRLFLAEKPLLMVLFKDQQTVEEIIQLRHQIYKDLIIDHTKEPEGKKLFTESFSRRLSPEIPLDKVDFSVSKTNPNRKARIPFL